MKHLVVLALAASLVWACDSDSKQAVTGDSQVTDIAEELDTLADGTSELSEEDSTTEDALDEDGAEIGDTVSPDGQTEKAPYIVHEWGVLANERVHGLPTHYESMDDKPILYFYTDETLTVDASVTFTAGTARETWPEVTLDSTVSWPALTLHPESCAQDHTPFPGYGEGQCDNPWEEPCEAMGLGNAVVADASCIEFEGVTSPLLFYAGTNSEPLIPVTGSYALHPVEPAEVSVTFTPTAKFEGQFLVIYRDIETQYDEIGTPPTTHATYDFAFVDVPEAVPEGGISVTLHPQVVIDVNSSPELEFSTVLGNLEDEFTAKLQGHGLTGAEAEAFVNNWSTPMFGCWYQEGHPSVPAGVSVTVIGVHQRSDFDAWMPLTLTPEPQELVRVLVSYTQL
mgnify:CR=1 FL=1